MPKKSFIPNNPADFFISAAQPVADPEQAKEEKKTTGTGKVIVPTKKTRNQHIQILITEEQREKLRKLAKENNISVNEIINQAIDSFIE